MKLEFPSPLLNTAFDGPGIGNESTFPPKEEVTGGISQLILMVVVEKTWLWNEEAIVTNDWVVVGEKTLSGCIEGLVVRTGMAREVGDKVVSELIEGETIVEYERIIEPLKLPGAEVI